MRRHYHMSLLISSAVVASLLMATTAVFGGDWLVFVRTLEKWNLQLSSRID